MENNIEPYKNKRYQKEEAYLRAEKKLKDLKGFYWHAFWYLVVNIFIIVMVSVNNQSSIWHFGTLSTPLFWGIGLAFHALSIFSKGYLFGKSWEERKIQEYMEKDKNQWE